MNIRYSLKLGSSIFLTRFQRPEFPGEKAKIPQDFLNARNLVVFYNINVNSLPQEMKNVRKSATVVNDLCLAFDNYLTFSSIIIFNVLTNLEREWW